MNCGKVVLLNLDACRLIFDGKACPIPGLPVDPAHAQMPCEQKLAESSVRTIRIFCMLCVALLKGISCYRAPH